MAYKIAVASVIIAGILIIFVAQFAIPVLFSADGYLHIRIAEFLRQYGPRYNFHWARFSTFAHNFADKDFLYHVFLIPFTFFGDIFWGAKLSAALFAALLFIVYWRILIRYCRLKWLVVVFLAMFFASAHFLRGLEQPRNMIPVIGLTLIFVHGIVQQKRWLLFMVSAAYALSHVSAPYLLLYALLAESVRYANLRAFAWRSLLAVAAGLLLGFLLHPNLPNNFLVFYLNGILVPMFALKWGLELGAEFFPIDTRGAVLGYPFLFVCLLLLLASCVSASRKITLATQIWMAVAALFLVFSFFSQRYFLQGYPLFLVALAGYFSDWWLSSRRAEGLRKNKAALSAVFLLAAAAFSAMVVYVYRDFKGQLRNEVIYNGHCENIGRWMKENIPPGEIIFHTNWSDSQYFIGLNPKNDYLVTLDPIYMYYWNSNIYKIYRDVSFGRSSAPYEMIREVFGARYGYAGKIYFMGLVNQVKQDSRFEVLAEDGLGVIFKLN